MNEILASTELIGAFLFLGGAVFYRAIRRFVSPGKNDFLNRLVVRRTSRLMISGATIFVSAALTELLFSSEQAGVGAVLPIALAPVFVAFFLAGETRKSPLLANLAAIPGLIAVGCLVAASHAAGEPGLLPIASSLVHWIVALSWGGCLVYLPLMPWSRIRSECEQGSINMSLLVRRHANLALAALGFLALSGGLLAFVHVHNADAMTTTHYGRFVILKASLGVILLVTVIINRLTLSRPAMPDQVRAVVRGFRAIVSIEAILLAGLLVATGNLEALSPAGLSPFNNPQSWQMKAGEVPLTITLQPVGGSSTRVRIEISAADPDYRFDDGTLSYFDLYSADHDAGGNDVEAVWIGPSGFLGDAVVAVPGDWTFELRLEYPDGSTLTGKSELVLPALPLKGDLKPYLSFAAIGYSLPGLITFVVGVLLLSSAAWLARKSWLGSAPSWLLPVSMANMILGGYLALSVVFVKTYPTTFRSNPEPYNADVIRQGEVIYREHCAECHGIAGKGDGPWAIEERGSIPDLSAPHMDVHTDGELFWWITKGIPSLDKPPLEDELDHSDRWTVINYTRSLRHGMPPE